MIYGIIAVIWIVMGIVSYGLFLHEYKRDFNYFAAFPFALLLLSTGPASLLSTIMCHKGSWGFGLVPYTRAERWKNFDATYNQPSWYIYKTREQFDEEY